ncbi:oligosaccharide flippase family protein [Planococcus donghaensis]|uniref:Polysaccharide biosynthesis protein n=1 Tax=Planococcus donghaensis TaxID=414778 RepID=A0A1C7EGI2_9BACL|nr:oligosaccharide flippase family protein [Planococcus donghaensis]ANU22487.1 hypothetical protein BCM40_03570 [Planococcus donghaensis]
MKKINLKTSFSKNKKNIAKISSGTMMGHIISLITLPILTRIYGAEIFGIWAFIYALSIIINSFSDLGMSNLIMIEKEEKLKKYYKVISTISFIISTLFSLIVTVVYFIIFNDIALSPYVFYWILFFSAFLSQQVQICYTWLNRNQEYNALMKNPVLNYSVYGISGIIFGYMGFIQYGFYIAHLLGSLITLIHMKKNLPRGLFVFNVKEVFKIIYSNKKFIFYQVPTNLTNNLKSQSPTLLIKVLWGPEILGYYAITLRILQMPIILIAKAIGRVFFQVVSDMHRQSKEIGAYVLKNIKRAMKLSIIPITLLIAFGDIIVIIFLGKEWEVSGNFVRILALQYFFVFLQDSVQGLAITLNKQKYTLIANTFQITGLIFSLIVGKYIFNSVYISLLIMSSIFILIQIVYFTYLFKVLNVPKMIYFSNILKNVCIILAFSTLFRCIYNYLS